jgi:hypothetical protein
MKGGSEVWREGGCVVKASTIVTMLDVVHNGKCNRLNDKYSSTGIKNTTGVSILI